MKNQTWRWVLGLVYILTVASIWIAASFVVQSVVDAGVSPFLVTYICNSLFVIYVPLIEIIRFLEDKYGTLLFWQKKKDSSTLQEDSGESEEAILLDDGAEDSSPSGIAEESKLAVADKDLDQSVDTGLDAKGRWTRSRVAKVSLLICPFWFLAQLTFNLSLKYTTVTSNTILSSSSSLFTFLVSLVFLGEIFTWVKLISVLLCMGGTIIVSLGDSKSGSSKVASNPVLGDILALLSSAFYAVYITLIRKKLPDDDGKSGHASMAQFLGFLGLFNLLIFLPIPLVLNFANLEPFNTLTWKQLGLIVGKGMFDNVLSDLLWAKAILLTSTTVATAGLTIQVPLAAIVDTLTGNAPPILDYIGAAAVMVGFAGINIPSDACSVLEEASIELENGKIQSTEQDHLSPR
ncbi:thiamine-repressible mitochondrial transport protein THI74-like [Nicotiana tabacum]|uniref:Thiamine-repressible mitochondrial transport protein THI74-like n=2 Tax=Nicotiana TaxID=4085 RepID=A0A1S4CRU6_TOBAC|nr:PREDICTED: thiamine-repressible mitochondrial transport protein THI74 [Nicotiana sylvestris]XP_016503987.1 PREDICTED: thiamine-repressible mitochondrial transport protein THI74-like [Nicotiana tabacum]